jgi:large subunit ribosomal protein L13
LKTYTARPVEINKRWYHIDATDLVLGRLASEVANLLRGKYKPYFTPHLDVGDFVIITNASKLRVTGRKLQRKIYYHHSGYIGNLKEIPLWRMMEKSPEKVIRLAVRRMLPKNKLGQDIYRKLKVFAGPEHPHEAQRPITLNFDDLLGKASPFMDRPELVARQEIPQKEVKPRVKPERKVEPEVMVKTKAKPKAKPKAKGKVKADKSKVKKTKAGSVKKTAKPKAKEKGKEKKGKK